MNGYGPWYSGKYNAAILSFEKRYSHHFTLGGSYAFTSEDDDASCSSLGQGPTGICDPTDSFVGTTTTITDPVTGQTNATSGFTASNGNYVPKSGIFWNGPKLDEGLRLLAARPAVARHGSDSLTRSNEVVYSVHRAAFTIRRVPKCR